MLLGQSLRITYLKITFAALQIWQMAENIYEDDFNAVK